MCLLLIGSSEVIKMHMKNKRYQLITAVLLATSFVVSAQQQERDPSASRLQQHVSYLASDALDGRRTGTAGANDAARYIAGEFGRLGLRPPSGGGSRRPSQIVASYLQKFPYVAGVELGQPNQLIATRNGVQVPLNVRKDWMPLGFSGNAAVESVPAVFVGYGITAAELNYNDYSSNEKVAGKVVIALTGTPDGDNPHGRFTRYEGVRWKAVAARNAGAKALLIVARENDFTQDSLARLRHDHNAGDAGIPVVVISRQGIEKLLENKPLSEIEQAAKSKGDAAYAPIGWSMSVTTNIVRQEVPAYNVVGILEGSDPVLKKENIVIGAHYDHLGRGGEGSGSLAPRSGEIHHGADDNASGTAGLIELARVFSAQRPRLKRTVIFIAFGGEEEGLLGSNYYVNNPLTPLTNTVAMINMDMIGRMKDGKLTIGGVGTAKEWRDIIGQKNDLALTLNEDGFGPSDHSSFYGKQVPVLFFFTGTHTDYHKPSDTFDKINYADEARILSLVARIVRDVDGADKRLTYLTARSDATPRTGGFRVYLGTIPNYGEGTGGLLIDGVREGSPAEKAGIKAGDKIVKIGEREIKNVYDYTFALGEMKAGQEYAFEVTRGTEKLTLKLTPAARN
jgi:aminopeptidase YwaD